MTTPTIQTFVVEGETYVKFSDFKSDSEGKLGRIKQLGEQKAQLESTVNAKQNEIDSLNGQLSSTGNLNEEIARLKGELGEATTKFDRFKSLTSAGITDSDHIEYIEWQYNKAMKGVEAPVSMDTWIKAQKDDENAPKLMKQILSSDGAGGDQKPPAGPSGDQKPLVSQKPPPINLGAEAPAVVTQEWVDSVLDSGNPELYRKHQPQIESFLNQSR